MMRSGRLKQKGIAAVAVVLLLAIGRSVPAQDRSGDDWTVYVGGGVGGVYRSDINDLTTNVSEMAPGVQDIDADTTGFAWTGYLGTRGQTFGAEIGYIGQSRADFDFTVPALGGHVGSSMKRWSVYVALTADVGSGWAVQPYVKAGLGWAEIDSEALEHDGALDPLFGAGVRYPIPDSRLEVRGEVVMLAADYDGIADDQVFGLLSLALAF